MNLETVELKAFVPAADMQCSQRFYRDLGFVMPWSSDDLAYLHCGHCSFLLRLDRDPEHSRHCMMHLLVADVEAWWKHVCTQRIAARYRVRHEPPADRPWNIRDFVLADPSGVLWRIGQNIDPPASSP